MSDYTVTPNYLLKKPVVNSDIDLWGDHLNQNADVIDTVIKQQIDGLAGIYLPLVGGQMTGMLTFAAAAPGLVPAIGQPVPSGYWTDFTAGLPINRLGARQFIGSSVAYDGAITGSSNPFGAVRWVQVGAQLLAESSGGAIGIAGLSKTSEANPPAGFPNVSSIGIAGVGYNDYTGGVGTRRSWAGYLEGWRVAGAGAAFALEIDIGNSGDNRTDSPYSMFGNGAFGLTVAAGGSSGNNTTPSSSALSIANNTSTFNTGIVFGATAITGTDGVTGTGVAIALAKGHAINWYADTTGTPAASIISSATTPGRTAKLEFKDSLIEFSTPRGVQFAITDSGIASANYLSTHGRSAGASPVLEAVGSDTDISMIITPKGAGGITVSGGTVTLNGGALALNGATTNLVSLANKGLGAPTFTTRSAGTKFVAYPGLSGTTVDYGGGVVAGEYWQSVPQAIVGNAFTWYAGITKVASLNGLGEMQAASFRAASAAGPTWTAGAGAPAATMPNGSIYSRTDGTSGSRLYVSAGGGTWAAVAGV